MAFSDNLNKDGYLEPFYRQYDRNDRSKVTGYGRKQEYKGFTLEELDPLRRFTFKGVSKEESLFQEWFFDNKDA